MLEINQSNRNAIVNKKYRVLVFCGNGYVFDEIYKPVIEDLASFCHIDLLMADYYLTQKTKDSIEYLLHASKINSSQVIQSFSHEGSLFQYHKNLVSISSSFENSKLNLLLLSTDYMLVDRYLIHMAKQQSAKVVVLQTGTIIRILDKYRKDKRLAYEEIITGQYSSGCQKLKNIKNPIIKLRKIVAVLRRFFKKYTYTRVISVLNKYVFPWLLINKFFKSNNLDQFCFYSGYADACIVYDDIEYKAIKKVSGLNTIYHAVHPANSIEYQSTTTSELLNKKKLLVIFSGCLTTELEANKIEQWVNAIEKILSLSDIEEVHLRFHPRTSSACEWTKTLRQKIEKLECKVKVINALEYSLLDNLINYAGILGAPSGALRVAIAACKNIFVIGMPNCGDPPPSEESWVLGRAEGVRWVMSPDIITKEFLVPVVINHDKNLSVKNILNNLLGNKNATE